jgi:acyl carrier protein
MMDSAPLVQSTATCDSNDFAKSFHEVLLRHLPSGITELPEDGDLMRLGLDSMSGVALLLNLEETFAISFPMTMIGVELYSSVAALRKVVAQLMDSRPCDAPRE